MHNQPQSNAAVDLALLAHIDKVVEDRIAQHTKDKQPAIEGINERIRDLEELIRSGFPHGDPASHRRVHEKYIEEAVDRDQMVKGAKREVFKLSLWAALLFVASAVWDSVKAHLK